MRRLLQLGVLLLSVAAVLTPVVECFDRWDPAGSFMTDTELSVFALILVLCLVLLVGRLVARLRGVPALAALFRLWRDPGVRRETGFSPAAIVIPLSSPPLRI